MWPGRCKSRPHLFVFCFNNDSSKSAESLAERLLGGAAVYRCQIEIIKDAASAAAITREAKTILVIFQKRVADLTNLALERFVARARRAVGLKGTVNVLLTTSAEMKSLNRQFRAKDGPTDVLSFPAEPDGKKQLAGEIAISAEIATKNAHDLGHSPAEEIKILVLHGILHLRGYDHETDNGTMARREKQLRTELRLPLGLIERTRIEQAAPAATRRPISRERHS